MSAQVDFKFNTVALLRAYEFVETDKGKIAHCLANNTHYFVTSSGSGADVMTAVPSRFAELALPLNTWRECTSGGDVANIAANGGVLASDTDPILRAATTTEEMEIAWIADDVDAIICSVACPADLDGTLDVTVKAEVTAGTTNAFSATLATTWDGGTQVSDTLAGSALATIHTATATVAAADVPDQPEMLTIQLTPGAHAADAFLLHSMKVRYYRRSFV